MVEGVVEVPSETPPEAPPLLGHGKRIFSPSACIELWIASRNASTGGGGEARVASGSPESAKAMRKCFRHRETYLNASAASPSSLTCSPSAIAIPLAPSRMTIVAFLPHLEGRG